MIIYDEAQNEEVFYQNSSVFNRLIFLHKSVFKGASKRLITNCVFSIACEIFDSYGSRYDI